MKDLPESQPVGSKFPAGSSAGSNISNLAFINQKFNHIKSSKGASVWSSLFAPTFSIFEPHSESSPPKEKKTFKTKTNGWTNAVKRVVTGVTMWRLQERILGFSRTGVSCSNSETWLLGVCYKISPEESPGDGNNDNGSVAFMEDFSSRIWITYRKGFSAIGDSMFTSDVNWGCMLRSSQMLVAQALLVHHLGRSWRKPMQKPFALEYVEILHLFGDSEESTFSIHNLLHAGKVYGLSGGSWVGPYAVCRSWETLARSTREKTKIDKENKTLPMAVYIVSGDEDGERGGAPVVCIDAAARLCLDFCEGQAVWSPMLLLVPLVLGLDKINPRYIPLLWSTFTFPQSLGILGGRPGASTYIIGVQDNKAFFLDPHEVQQAVDISLDNLEVDTSSYHCNIVRHIPLESIDPSIAIGFYCRDKGDFDDFCTRASELVEQSSGAPLFTVVQSLNVSKPVQPHEDVNDLDALNVEGKFSEAEDRSREDDWQLL
ncbi:cysteine protease ATG4B-like isoform X2 [Aristolochia californica]|uniref:cysteine protease ATG4B-like isoform X2 n=1 Tax=Aristolochia californica TaxID=171875 RepID=UPI0035D700C0